MHHTFQYKKFVCGAALFIFLGIASTGFCAENPIIKTGDLFPEIPLALPQDSNFGDYLGIDPEKPFTIGNLKAELVLVEIMNINCGNCQRQAPVYNELFNKIESSPETKGKIKMLAIGAGNKDEFIKKYQDHFKAPYPIVEDPGLNIYNAIGKSPVPLAVYIRPDSSAGHALVLTTHTGYQNNPEAILSKMTSLMHMDEQDLKKIASLTEHTYVKVKPVITEDELQAKIETAFQNENINFINIEQIHLEDGSIVFMGSQKGNNSSDRIFARLVSQPPPCDLCHDAHYIYVFDKQGKILQFVPIRLSKYGNKSWSNEDILQMKQRLEGKFIYQPFNYDAKVDAITSATITSLVVIESLNEGKTVFDELKIKKLLD